MGDLRTALTATLRRTVGDDPGLLALLLESFARDADALAHALAEAADAGTWREAHRHAHSLKGLYATLALDGLAELALAAESACGAGAAEPCRLASRALCHAWDGLRGDLPGGGGAATP
mgnify:CR=1 FL=1